MSCPSDIRASLSVNSTALVNWTEPVARDNSNLIPNVTVAPPGTRPPRTFNKTTLVIYTAMDTSGNKKQCSFKVILEGNTKTVILSLDVSRILLILFIDLFIDCFIFIYLFIYLFIFYFILFISFY